MRGKRLTAFERRAMICVLRRLEILRTTARKRPLKDFCDMKVLEELGAAVEQFHEVSNLNTLRLRE